MGTRTVLSILTILFLRGVTASGQTLPDNLQARIEKLREEAGIPGLALAVVRRKAELQEGYFGVRSVGDPLPVDRATVFEAASLSKPVFAAAVLQLAGRGDLDLDAPLWSIHPYERLEHDERSKRITTRMVLSHSAGLPHWGDSPLEFSSDPGERWGYSREGFVYLQKAMEKKTGLSLDEFVRKEIFDPFGMPDSSYVWQETFENRIASGHNELGEPQRIRRRQEGNAANSLITTVRDFGRFLSALLENGLLQDGTLERMRVPQILVSSRRRAEPVNLFWALGWGVQRGPRGHSLWQWGDNGNYRCFTLLNPEQGYGLVYFTNSNSGLSIGREVVAESVGEHQASLFKWLGYDPYDDPGRLARIGIRKSYLGGDYQEAFQALQDLRVRSPETADLDFLNSMGSFLMSERLHVEAIDVFQLSIREFPDLAPSYQLLGEAHLEADQFESSRQNYLKAIDLDPELKEPQRALQWIGEIERARQQSLTLSESDLQRLAGEYGPRRVTLREGSLYYSREESGTEYRLIPMGKSLFALQGLNSFRLEFSSDESGRVIKVVGHYLNVHTDEHPRDP